ncbi:MAG: carbohydrate ABC transporter permease, partial [Candidatus Parcubacteria bacterium]|nr:carbohydrate ABC transporter permease [Candidatus Parcubacteria bacterium]
VLVSQKKPLGYGWRTFWRTGDWWHHLWLIILLFLMFVPILMMIIISFKTLAQFSMDPYMPTFPLHPENYTAAFKVVSVYIWNSLIVSGVSVIGMVILATLSAWAFARYPFPGREVLFYMILALLMIPGELTLVPSFLLVKTLGLINTRWVLILPYIAGGQVFAIFVLRSFFEGMPEELFEAARIDGASEMNTFLRIGMPMAGGIVGVVAIMHITSTWNDLIWPMITVNVNRLMTLTIGLYAFRSVMYTQWGGLMAGYTIASIPMIILFAFTSKLFVEGLASGALKM